jgi:Flp pilus assembly protein TadG
MITPRPGIALSQFRCARSGASAVEFALILPAFLAIVFGIVMFGSYLAVIHGVQQLAAEAARSSVAGLSESERSQLANGYVTANAASYILIDPSHLTVDAAPSASDANVFTVTVRYDASGMFIYALPSFVPSPPSIVERAAAIPRGGY